MFARNPAVERGIDRAFKAMAKMGRGDMLHHERIEECFGIPRNTAWWSRGIEKLRKKMLDERGVWLASEPLVGYRLAPHEEHIAEGPRRTRRAMRQNHKALVTLSALPDDELSFQNQRRKEGLVRELEALEHTTRQKLRLQQFLMRPTPVQARIARPEDQAETA